MSIEAEQALIGCILINNKAFELVPEIEPHHMHEHHRIIYAAMHKDLIRSKPVDPITVFEDLRLARQDEYCGGLKYLTQLANSGCTPKNIKRHGEIILETHKRNVMKIMAFGVMRELDDGVPTAEIAGNVSKTLQNLTETADSTFTMTECLNEHIDVMGNRETGDMKFLPTGLVDLDRKLEGGFNPGDLVILAARPSMGKTMCALTIALKVAETHRVMFFSLEMPKSQLMDRAIANYGSIPISWVKNPRASQDDYWANHSNAVRRLQALDLVIDDRAGRKILDIVAIAKAEHRKKPLNLVVVDYLGLIRGGNAANRNLELGDYTKQLKELAKTLQCPVLLLAQLNRGVESRGDKRPLMSDLRDSGEIEADADTIMLLYRDEYHNPDTRDKGIVEIIIPKQRQGETGFVGCQFNGQFQRFEDLAYTFQRSTTPVKSNNRGLD